MTDNIQKILKNDVLDLLKVACKQDTLLQVMVEYEPPACMTRIHSINLADNSLLIRHFGVSSLDDLLLHGANLEVALKVNDKAYRFDSNAVDEVNHMDSHCISIPKEIEIIKRRMYFRVDPPCVESVVACIQFKNTDSPIPTTVSNLSVGGVLISQRIEQEEVEVGSITLLKLKFESGNAFSFKSRICHVSLSDADSGGCNVGLEFLNQLVGDEIILGEILMQWQEQKK